jgi:AraC-like DNA-binding protein
MQGPGVAEYPPGARMAPRTIDDWEFVWMLRGEALFAAGEEVVPLTPGSLLLVTPGLVHAFTWDRRRPSRHGYVHFRPESRVPEFERSYRMRRMSDDDPMAGLCAYLIWLGHQRPSGWRDEATQTLGFLYRLFGSRSLPGDGSGEHLPAPLEAVIEHLRSEWAHMPIRRIGVLELAAIARTSRSYLSRRFRAEFGVSAAAAMEDLRFARAETLLTRTDMTVGSIARQCGFADPFHFSHRFARRYRIAPSKYRIGGTSSVLDDPGVRRLVQRIWH